jgi:molybdate transport system substrate-binding protein
MWCRPGRSASSRVQQVMLFSAGVPTNARQPEAVTELIWFLPSPDAAETVETGLDPRTGC